jgi:hypothetical protein
MATPIPNRYQVKVLDGGIACNITLIESITVTNCEKP